MMDSAPPRFRLRSIIPSDGRNDATMAFEVLAADRWNLIGYMDTAPAPASATPMLDLRGVLGGVLDMMTTLHWPASSVSAAIPEGTNYKSRRLADDIRAISPMVAAAFWPAPVTMGQPPSSAIWLPRGTSSRSNAHTPRAVVTVMADFRVIALTCGDACHLFGLLGDIGLSPERLDLCDSVLALSHPADIVPAIVGQIYTGLAVPMPPPLASGAAYAG